MSTARTSAEGAALALSPQSFQNEPVLQEPCDSLQHVCSPASSGVSGIRPIDIYAEALQKKMLSSQLDISEFICHHSLLAEKAVPPLDRRALAHVLLDSEVRGTHLEGWSQKKACLLISEILKAYSSSVRSDQQDELSKLAALFADAINTEDFIKTSTNSELSKEDVALFTEVLASRIDSNKPMLIAGGWCGTPTGHAIYMEIQPNKPGLFSVIVHNSGDGLEKYHPRITESGSRLFLPFLKKQDVSRESLLGYGFIRGLLTIKNVDVESTDEGDKKVDYTAKDFYDGLLQTLDGTFEKPEPEQLLGQLRKLCISDQISGTCTFSGLMAMAHTSLSEKNFSTLKYMIGWKSIVGFYQFNEADLKASEESRELLSRSVRIFIQQSLIDNDTGLLDDSSLMSAYATGQDILNHLQQFSDNRSAPAKSFTDLGTATLPSTSLPIELRSPAGGPENVSAIIPTSTLLRFDPLNVPEPINFLKYLRGLNANVSNWFFCNPFYARFFFEEFIEKLDFPHAADDYWSQIPAADIEECITIIAKLTEKYVWASRRHGIRGTEEEDVILEFDVNKATAIVRKLLLRTDPKLEGKVPACDWSPNETFLRSAPLSYRESSKLLEQPDDDSLNDELSPFYRYAKDDTSGSYFSCISEYVEQHPEIQARLAREGVEPDKMSKVCYCDADGSILPRSLVSWHRLSVLGDLIDKELSFDSFARKDVAPHHIRTLHFNSPCDTPLPLISIYDAKTDTFSPVSAEHLTIQATITDYPDAPFLAAARKLTEPGQAEQEVVRCMMERQVPQPQQVISNLEMTEFLHAICGDQAYVDPVSEKGLPQRIIRLLAYVHASSTSLKQPVFQDLILSIVQQEIEGAICIPDLEGHIEQVADACLKLKHVHACCVARLFAVFAALAQTIEKPENVLDASNIVPDKFFETLLALCSNPEEASLVHRTWLACFATLYDSTMIPDDILPTILMSKMILAQRPAPKSFLDRRVEKMIFMLQPRLAKLMENQGKELFAKLIAHPLLMTECHTTDPLNAVVANYPHYTFGPYTLNLLDSVLSVEGDEIFQSLPLRLRNHPDWRAVFRTRDFTDVKRVGGRIYTCNNGRSRVIDTEQGARIQQQFDGEWFEYVPSGYIKNGEASSLQYFFDTTFQWVSVSLKTILFIDKETQAITYRGTIGNGNQLHDVIDIGPRASGASLVLSPPLDHPIVQLCSRIEVPAYLCIWKTDRASIIVKMPRLGLAFEVNNEVSSVARMVSPNGYSISSQQQIAGVTGFENFLLIENKKGDRKAIVPCRKLDLVKSQSKNPFLSVAVLDQTVLPHSDGKQFYLIDVTPENQLSTHNREESFMVAYILFGQKKYRDGILFLRPYSCQDICALSSRETEILEWIFQIFVRKDGKAVQSLQACAAILCAVATLVKNARMFGGYTDVIKSLESRTVEPDPEIDGGDPDGCPTILDFVEETYSRYLSAPGSFHRFLIPEEELALIAFLSSRPCFEQRINDLKQRETFAEAVSLAPTLELETPEYLDIEKEKYCSQIREHRNPYVCKHFILNFLSYYKKAKDGDESVRELVLTRKPEGKFLARILLSVSKNPGMYPDYAEMVKHRDEIEFFGQMFKIGNGSPHESSALSYREIRPYMTSREQILGLTLRRPAAEVDRCPLVPLDKLLKLVSLDTMTEGKTLSSAEVSQIQDFFSPARLWADEELKSELIHAKELSDVYYTLSEEDVIPGLGLLREHLLAMKYKAEEERASFEAKLLKRANKMPNDIRGIRHAAAVAALTESTITVSDLVVFFLQQSPSVLHRKNSTLQLCQLNKLNQSVFEYLMKATAVQRMDRALDFIEDVAKAKNPSERELKLNDLIAEVTATRSAALEQNSAYIVFEYLSGCSLRPSQIKTIEAMKHGVDGVFHLATGSGKTKVISPIAALQQADGEHLSIILSPEALICTDAANMQATLGQIFSQYVRVVHINRASDFSEESMKSLYEDLQQIIVEKKCLMMTGKSASCLLLEFTSELINYLQKPEIEPLPHNLVWIQRCLSLLKKSGMVIIDEIDQALFSRHEVNFPLDRGAQVSPERLDCVEDVYFSLIEAFDFSRGAVCDTARYLAIREEIAKSLLTRQVHRLAPIKEFVEKHGLGNCIQFILGADILCDQIEDDTVGNLLSVMRGEITSILPLTLGKQIDTAYGRSKTSPTKFLAIPYCANNTPSESSDFGNLYERLNYTMQTYLIQGIPEAYVRSFVEKTLNQIVIDKRMSPQADIKSFPSYKTLADAVGYECDIFDPTLVKAVSDHLKRNIPERIRFIRKHFLPLALISENKVSVTAPGLVEMFGHVQGFTGTPWNISTFPGRLQSNFTMSPGTYGAILSLLWKKADPEIAVVEDGAPDHLVEQLCREISALQSCRAFIDVGAILHGADNAAVSQQMLNSLPETIEGIAFFKDDILVVLNRRGNIEAFNDSDLADRPDQRLTYFDQRHATGADVKQSATGTALVSFSEDIPIRDIFQGIGRMRELSKNQNVKFVVRTSTALVLTRDGGKLCKQALLYKAATVQAQLIDAHRLVATAQKRDEVLKQAVLEELLSHETLTADSVHAVGAKVQKILVAPTGDCPYESFGRKQKVLGRDEFLHLKTYERDEAMRTLWPEGYQMMLALIEQTVKACPVQESEIIVSVAPQGLEVETERETEIVSQTEHGYIGTFFAVRISNDAPPEQHFVCALSPCNDSDQSNDSSPCESLEEGVEGRDEACPSPKSDDCSSPGSYGSHSPDSAERTDAGVCDTSIKPECFAVSSILRNHNSPYKDLFDERLLISESICGWGDERKLFSLEQPPISFILGIRDRDGIMKIRLLRAGEFFMFETQKFPKWRSSATVPVVLAHLSALGCLDKAGPGASELVNDPVYQALRTQARFFNGEMEYSDEEMEYLRSWIGNRKDEFRSLFLNEILRYHPDKKIWFSGSILSRIL